MARRIERHATRRTGRQAALGTGFAAQQRVMTIDGLPGRVLFVSGAFAPGLTEYQVVLDSGMGQGIYTESQLRPLPDAFRGGSPGSNLPAGVTARYVTEDEARAAWRAMPEAQAGMPAEEYLTGIAATQDQSFAHLASDDYPEMGQILHERPDPGLYIRTVGSRTAADTYGRPDDPRDSDYSGGEGDLGLYWAEPAQQDWVHENLGPQEEAPPPAWMLPPPLARLAEIEEASALIGARHHATTINGTQIDDAGDAPQHGTIPRAGDPDGYDDQSAEGEGDSRWNEPLPGVDKEKANGATVGMYPEGMSAGGGPGLEIGAFTASRVPWTGEERSDLHDFDTGNGASWGDFVPSTEFTNQQPVIDEPESAELERAGRQAREAMLRTAVTEDDWADHLRDKHGYGQPGIDRILGQGNRPSHWHEALHEAGMANHSHGGTMPFTPGPETRPDSPATAEDLAASGRASVLGPEQWSEWTRLHRLSSKPPGPPDSDQVSSQDNSAPDSKNPQVSPGAPMDTGPDTDDALDDSAGEQQDPEDTDPQEWPLAGAHINAGGPAYTQGTHDQHGNVWPPPPPPAPSAPPGQEEGEDGGTGNDTGKTIEVHVAALGAASASPAFRFEFTASWADVRRKAQRIRKAGRVRITHASPGLVIGEVGGDHDVYESGIQRRPGHPQSMHHWACGCPWASFHQDKSLGTRYAGRPCSHVMALQLEALSRTRTGEGVREDPRPEGMPPRQVVVKSMPPWGAGGWAETWLAPAASRRTAHRLPYASEPEDHEVRAHLEHHHGLDANRLAAAGHGEMQEFHEAEHQRYGDEMSHQHHTPRGLPHEERYPALFRPREVDDLFGGYDKPGMEHEVTGEPRDEFFGHEPLHSFVPARPHLSALSGQDCLYRHDGPCPPGGVTARSLTHARPAGLEITDGPNPDHDPHWSTHPASQASHVIKAHLGGEHVGSLHYSQSDDGRAYAVHMLHSSQQGKGIASAMMDRLYSKARQASGFIDHGVRTDKGNSWWARYEEPHPEVNTHHVHPDRGWKNYFDPMRTAMDAEENRAGSGGRGAHTPIRWNPMAYPFDDHHEMWTHAEMTAEPPAKHAVAALLAAGEDPDEVLALARLASLIINADQANGPWGSENVTAHPPAKPYGATEAPDPDKDPGSYGPLAGPDPDNWGSIDEGSFIQMPLSNAAHKVLVPGAPDPMPPGLQVPSIASQDEQGTFGFSDRDATSSSLTGMDPGDPQGIRMEESLSPADDAEEFRRHLMEQHGYEDEPGLDAYHERHARDHEDVERGMAMGDPAPPGYAPHPYHETDHERRYGRDRWSDAASSPGFVASAGGCPCCGGTGEHLTGHECYRCDASGQSAPGPDCEPVFRDPVVHAQGCPAGCTGLPSNHDEPEPALPATIGTEGEEQRQDAGIDGTAGDAQDVPHPYGGQPDGSCPACGMNDGASVHAAYAVQGDPAEGTQLATQEPGMGSMDDALSPEDPSIQTVGNQQWSGGGTDSGEVSVPAGEPQGDLDDIVAAFQRSAAARQFSGGTPGQASGAAGGDIAAAARAYLAKTADVLPEAEAAELIGEGRGTRARNLGLLRLEGTHYEDQDEDLGRRGLSLDDFEDDVISA